MREAAGASGSAGPPRPAWSLLAHYSANSTILCVAAAALGAALSCVVAAAQPVPEPAPTTRPVTQPAQPEGVAAARARLARLRASEISDEGIVLKTTLELALALGRADGTRAAGLIDAVGYQTLPLTGDLPENPAKPLSHDEIRARIQARKPNPLDSLPATSLRTVDRRALRELFPAAAEWMLPEDWAVIIEPVGDRPDWVTRPCCVVVRLRAGKPSILGGNLFQALKAE